MSDPRVILRDSVLRQISIKINHVDKRLSQFGFLSCPCLVDFKQLLSEEKVNRKKSSFFSAQCMKIKSYLINAEVATGGVL